MTILEAAARTTGGSLKSSVALQLKNGKRVEVASIDEATRLDNTVRNPIRRFWLEAENGDVSSTGVSFSAENFLDRGPFVTLEVASSSGKAGSELFAELEEQIERTFVHGAIQRLKRQPFLSFVAFGLGLALSVGAILGVTWQSVPQFPLADAKRLHAMAENAASPDARLSFVFEAEKQRVEAFLALHSKSPAALLRSTFSVRGAFIALPLATIIACSVYLWRFCYPQSVFAWGDVEERYSAIVRRRKFIWSAIMASFVVGVLSNLFAAAVTGLKP
jgi:hypothetical protein